MVFGELSLWSLFAFRYSYRFFFALSLGFDICGNPENDPPQQSDHQQPGKQFDHDNPIIFKSIILFATVCMHCYFVLNYDLISDPIVA